MRTFSLAALLAGALVMAGDASSAADVSLVPSGIANGARQARPRLVILTQPALQNVSAGATVSLFVALDATLPTVTSGRLELWLKADAGVASDAYGRVRQWRDQSQNRNDASQPCAAWEPLLVFPEALAGRPALRFDGLADTFEPSFVAGHCISIGTYLKGDGQVDIPGAMTSFCVHKLAAASSHEYTLWVVGQPNGRIYGECRGDMICHDLMHFTFWAYAFDTAFAVPAGSYRIRTDRLAAGLDSLKMFDTSAAGTVKFSLHTSGAQPPLPGYFVGGFDPDDTFGRNLVGDIAELIIYQGALDDADLRAVTDYLQDKYFPDARLDGDPIQWLFDGTNIAGATNVTLILTNAQPAMSANYSVTVSNAGGLLRSSNALIAVKAAAPSRPR